MKTKKRLISLIITILMIISNLFFPFQQIVYAVGEKSITFSGNNLVVNQDGSITFDCEVEDNSGRITLAVYNAENQLIEAIAEGNSFDARVELNSTSYEGFYCMVYSDEVDLDNIKFDIAGHDCYINNNRLELPTDDVEHISIDYCYISPLHEKKVVSFYSDNISVNKDGSVNLYCDLEYNSGYIKTYLYNSDNTQVQIENNMYWEWDEEQETDILRESDTDAMGQLNTTTYQGAYLKMYSETVDLTDVQMDLYGNGNFTTVAIATDGRVDLPNFDWVYIDAYCFREVSQKKEIYFHANNLEINEEGDVILDVKIKNTSGKIKVTPRNSDGTRINVIKRR